VTSSIYENRSCPVCGSRSAKEEVHSARRAEALPFEGLRPFWSGFFKEKVFFSYARCDTCQLLFTPSFFTEEQLESLYAEMAPNMDVVPSKAIDATQRGYFDVAVRAARLDGGYLEIGPDVGYIVEQAVREGSFDHFWLFEPNRNVHDVLADATQGRPHTISADMTDLSAVPDGSIGLTLMVHVLDHLLDPVETLRQIRKKLRPDAKLVIVTHNEASALRYIMGTRWPPFCLQHPEVYNPASMRAMLAKAGYGTVQVSRSKNYFPIDFMVRQAAWTMGVRLDKLPLPKASIGLRLGNIITVASH
jgi:SAM-dependent methyltransferase